MRPELAYSARRSAVAALAIALLAPTSPAAQRQRAATRGGSIPVAAPALPPSAAASNASAKADAGKVLLAGHFLRRFGFGPTAAEVKAIAKSGPNKWLAEQLSPESIDDSAAEAALPHVDPYDAPWETINQRWFIRMAYSKRQVNEKMTLFWHELFNVSESKTGLTWMYEYENLLRKDALGDMRTMLVDISRNNAMLVWLDNNYNDGQNYDDDGNKIPPNENYARELMQLYSIGPTQLHMDGTPVIGSDGQPVPNYTEDDVKEVARALTGWYVNVQYEPEYKPLIGDSHFEPGWHDGDPKTVMGRTIQGRDGDAGAREVEDVVDLLLSHPSAAPFMAKQLVQKFATETPSPGYVERVATVFKNSNGNIKQVLKAIASDPEFTSDAVVRTQVKTPIEHAVGAVRGLGGTTRGLMLAYTAYEANQPLLDPPTVFGNYRPGGKSVLVNSATVLKLDSGMSNFANGYQDDYYWDSTFDPAPLLAKRKLRTPEKMVDYLATALLAGPLDAATRAAILDYMDGEVTDESVRGAAWLIICSPDYQKN